MERVFRKLKNFEEQDVRQIIEYVNLAIEQRQKIARDLKKISTDGMQDFLICLSSHDVEYLLVGGRAW